MDQLQIIPLPDDISLDDAFDKCYEEFKSSFMAKSKRPLLGNREIVFPANEKNWIEHKLELFWHASSLDQKIRFEILPCTNDVGKLLCDENCTKGMKDVLMSNGDIRYKCIYRSERVNLISQIVSLYNEGDSRVKYWERLHGHGREKRNRIYLRYQSGYLDYLLVFEHKSEKRVTAITAFPVFFKSDSEKYDKYYNEYIEEIKNR
ncbi:MAG: hypothetical protein MJ128_05430 [Mogibacterium sp.]|nr:hypothetical protein [Mogibacterium sp.]